MKALMVGRLDGQKRGYTARRAFNLLLALLVSVGTAAAFARVAAAQTAAPGASQKPKAAAAAPRPAAAPRLKVDANLLQLMRGILYPSSNVVFAAQSDISKLEKPADPSVSPNPLTNSYGGWQAVENAALAISESANLLVLPGRVCSNGKPVPIQRPDWLKFSQQLQTASMTVYKAAQNKDSDGIVDVAGDLTDACMKCHNVYREKADLKDRCTP